MTNVDTDSYYGGRGEGGGQGDGSTTRSRILQIALSLMSQRGVDGTSMRDLASAAGLNVASLYHYFPSKRDLLEAVLIEHGFFPVQASTEAREGRTANSPLEVLLSEILISMFEVEDFIRLMIGEAIRAESTARSVGYDLFATFQTSIEEWIGLNRPDLEERVSAAAAARLLSTMIVGVFVEYAAGVLEGQDLTVLAQQRAQEAAAFLNPPN
ncbi:MAG TPA: TetR/AcrR family transcriptional regulator [Acidimicrobiales bacterium]